MTIVIVIAVVLLAAGLAYAVLAARRRRKQSITSGGAPPVVPNGVLLESSITTLTNPQYNQRDSANKPPALGYNSSGPYYSSVDYNATGDVGAGTYEVPVQPEYLEPVPSRPPPSNGLAALANPRVVTAGPHYSALDDERATYAASENTYAKFLSPGDGVTSRQARQERVIRCVCVCACVHVCGA
jgi:hypothetical protein